MRIIRRTKGSRKGFFVCEDTKKLRPIFMTAQYASFNYQHLSLLEDIVSFE